MDFADALPLARAVLDRAAEVRTDPEVLARARRDPATRVLVVGGGELVVDETGAAALLDPETAGRVADAASDGPVDGAPGEASGDGRPGPGWPADEQWLLLGRDGDGAQAPFVLGRRVRRGRQAPRTGQASDVLVHDPAPLGAAADPVLTLPSAPSAPSAAPSPVPSSAPSAALSSVHGLRWALLRDAGADLPARDAGLATMAVALDEWHARHPRCPRCGARTVPVQAGWVRRCTVDGSEHYPRTDPAIIVAVVDDEDRVLLGHNAAWPAGRFSTLAGFVEAGESAEHAVRREVQEETSVVVDRLDYRGSQPWPFPASLMLAYRGHASRTEVAVDGVEVTEARWFTRDGLAQAVRDGEVLLPMRTSVAYALITDWFGAPLPSARW